MKCNKYHRVIVQFWKDSNNCKWSQVAATVTNARDFAALGCCPVPVCTWENTVFGSRH